MPMQRIRDVREVKQVAVDGEMRKRANREQLRRSISVTRISNTKSTPSNGLLLYYPLNSSYHNISHLSGEIWEETSFVLTIALPARAQRDLY